MASNENERLDLFRRMLERLEQIDSRLENNSVSNATIKIEAGSVGQWMSATACYCMLTATIVLTIIGTGYAVYMGLKMDELKAWSEQHEIRLNEMSKKP